MKVELTPRQLEFLSLTARGMQFPDIAVLCFVRPNTVQQTLDEARRRLGAKTLPQAVAIAISSDLLVLGMDGIASVPAEPLAA